MNWSVLYCLTSDQFEYSPDTWSWCFTFFMKESKNVIQKGQHVVLSSSWSTNDWLMIVHRIGKYSHFPSNWPSNTWNREGHTRFHVVHGIFIVVCHCMEFVIQLYMITNGFVYILSISIWLEISIHHNRCRHFISLIFESEMSRFTLPFVQFFSIWFRYISISQAWTYEGTPKKSL